MEGRDASGRLLLRALAQRSVTDLAGVGPKKAEALEEMGITSVLDLVTHYPRRYIDRTQQVAVKDLKVGDEAMVLAHVKRVSSRRTRQGRALVEIDVFDGTAYLRCTFFNQGWRAKQLVTGRQAVFFGKLDLYRGRRQMTNPVVDLVGDRTGRIVPVYPQSDKAGLTTWELGDWIAEALRRAGDLADPLPSSWQERLGMVERSLAMRQVHAPESMQAKDAGRRRLAFDELARLQVALVMRKRILERQADGISHVIAPGAGAPALLEEFRRQLPFALTGAQERAIAVITEDLAKAHPMHRLLQGDVGAGKTVVALAALLVAVQGGHQGALMAPTEVLAEQHFAGVRSLLGELTVPDDSTLDGRPGRAGRAAHQPHHTHRAETAARRPEHGDGRHPRRYPRPAHRGGDLSVARRRGGRRAAPVRCRAARHPEGQGPVVGRRRPRRARHDGDADSPDGSHDGLR